jgi:hypothetical protein
MSPSLGYEPPEESPDDIANATTWRSRIVGHGTEDPMQLVANPRNWRVHPKAQQDALENVLDQVGWVASVMVNRQTGFVVDGHARVALAITRGEPRIPVDYVDLTESEEGVIMATFDPIAAMAATDKDALERLLQSTAEANENITTLISDIAEREGIQSLDVLGPDSITGAARENNNMQKLNSGDGEMMNFTWGSIMVAIDRSIYERVWDVINDTERFPERRDGLRALLDCGLDALGENGPVTVIDADDDEESDDADE